MNPNELSGDISPQSVLSKMSLLLLHFPKLRIMWSRRPLHTVSIFSTLKRGKPEPDVQTACALGSTSNQGAEQVFNMTPQDLLRQLPGVHAHNYRKLMNSVLNLQELAAKLLTGRTVVLVTHDPLEALRLGHVIHVMTGRPARLDDPLLLTSDPPRDPTSPAIVDLQRGLLAKLGVDPHGAARRGALPTIG